MRLIDADKLKEYHCSKMCDSEPCRYPCVEVKWINNQPTAYDIDKVVEQLEEESFCAEVLGGIHDIIILDSAIEIVKEGTK